MMDDVLYLLGEVYTKDGYGVPRPVYTNRQVFCKVESVTRAEFAAAGRNGLNPSQVFSVAAADYGGERTLEWRGERYAIYRTYREDGSDYLELYAQREGGTNGGQS